MWAFFSKRSIQIQILKIRHKSPTSHSTQEKPWKNRRKMTRGKTNNWFIAKWIITCLAATLESGHPLATSSPQPQSHKLIIDVGWINNPTQPGLSGAAQHTSELVKLTSLATILICISSTVHLNEEVKWWSSSHLLHNQLQTVPMQAEGHCLMRPPEPTPAKSIDGILRHAS